MMAHPSQSSHCNALTPDVDGLCVQLLVATWLTLDVMFAVDPWRHYSEQEHYTDTANLQQAEQDEVMRVERTLCQWAVTPLRVCLTQSRLGLCVLSAAFVSARPACVG